MRLALPFVALAASAAYAAAATCAPAPAGHSSCSALKQACASQNAGGLVAADTTSAALGGTFACDACDDGEVPGSGSASAATGSPFEIGDGNFNMLEGQGLHFALAVLGVTVLLLGIGWHVKRGNQKSAATARYLAAEGSGGQLPTPPPVDWQARYGTGWCAWLRVTALGWTGYVDEESGRPKSFVRMLRNVQPWELMYCTTCGVKFVCGDESSKFHFLRWARFYFGLCLSFGLSIMFSALAYDALFHNPSCHLVPAAAAAGTTGVLATLSGLVGSLPFSKFTSTYLTVLFLVKAADIAVGRLTEAVTKRGSCASMLARCLILGLGLGFVGLAVWFQWQMNVDLSATMKLLAYAKMVLVERLASWCGLTPFLLVCGYSAGRCLHRAPRDPEQQQGIDLAGTAGPTITGGGPLMAGGHAEGVTTV